jgi:hypothetical protein
MVGQEYNSRDSCISYKILFIKEVKKSGHLQYLIDKCTETVKRHS